jgi:hypothetical protein
VAVALFDISGKTIGFMIAAGLMRAGEDVPPGG